MTRKSTPDRPMRFELRLSEDEAVRLRRLADIQGISAADVLRTLLSKAWLGFNTASGRTLAQVFAAEAAEQGKVVGAHEGAQATTFAQPIKCGFITCCNAAEPGDSLCKEHRNLADHGVRLVEPFDPGDD